MTVGRVRTQRRPADHPDRAGRLRETRAGDRERAADQSRSDHGAKQTPANDDDYPAHRSTYEAFVGLTKYGTIALVILLILMAYFLL